MLIPDRPTADIGTDHALLSLYLLDTGICSSVIATEIADHPYQRAREAARQSRFSESLQVRQGDGLQPLRPGEAANVIIAGMGGDTIAKILAADWDKASTFRRFIFQPMSRPAVLRQTLAEQGWPILEEKLIIENRHFFIIMAVSPGSQPYLLSPLELDLGSVILRQTGKERDDYLRHHYRRYQRVRDNLRQSRQESAEILLAQVEEKMSALEVLLNDS